MRIFGALIGTSLTVSLCTALRYSYNANPLTWEAAKSDCENKISHLVDISSQLENTQVFNYLKTSSLTNVQNIASINFWIGYHSVRTNEYEWVTEREVSFEAWAENEPSLDTDQDCVAARYLTDDVMEWYDDFCTTTKPYVCEDSCPASNIKGSPGICGCQEYDTDANGDGIADCFEGRYTYYPNTVSRDQASLQCTNQGLQLAHVRSIFDERVLFNSVLKSFGGTAGSSVIPTEVEFWMDLMEDDVTAVWAWTDMPSGSIDYEHWGTDFPVDDAGTDCVYNHYDAGIRNGDQAWWGDESCDGVFKAYVCEDMCLDDPTKSRPGFCGCGVPDTDSNNNGVFDCFENTWFFYNDLVQWNDARAGCMSRNQHFADIKNVYENSQIQRFVVQQIGGIINSDGDYVYSDDDYAFWIGLSDDTVPALFEWDSGVTYQYRNWLENEPNNRFGLEDCVRVLIPKNSAVQYWMDATCTQEYAYLCEDECPTDPLKDYPGICGCGVVDSDSDNDGLFDCFDGCPNDFFKSLPGACGCGVSDVDANNDGILDCFDSCPNDPLKTAPGVCGCGISDADSDNDGFLDCLDGCPLDFFKTAPGVCGCGIVDTDSDNDGAPDCSDGCPFDFFKVAPGVCGCGTADTDSDSDGVPNCNDGCPFDQLKVASGTCGCGQVDSDSDFDGTPDCNDGCPLDSTKLAPGTCGCGSTDGDSDNDGLSDCNDGCPFDFAKFAPGVCGCGVADTDSDNDGTPNCNDGCPTDSLKLSPGTCGCGITDSDSDNDGTANCNDGCPNDFFKVAPGTCGCGTVDTDSDNDNVPDCNDGCPFDQLKLASGTCGCGISDADSDFDGTADCNDGCPSDSSKLSPGICGCGIADTDSDGDGSLNCVESCDFDPNKTQPGVCGCGIPDTDSDNDGVPNCNDGCPTDPLKISAGVCGCGFSDIDSDGDSTADCSDGCPFDPFKTNPGSCGCGSVDYDFDLDGFADCDPVYPCQEDSDCPQNPDLPAWVCFQDFCTTEAPSRRSRRKQRKLRFAPELFCYCYNPTLNVGRMP
mmetsp:Transcript_18440/g.26795  ORF Transcript_18440/g.26795 Transcript_18440/m.26795 type:complete len:1037 (-) Transcript_18440:65-3175(-)